MNHSVAFISSRSRPEEIGIESAGAREKQSDDLCFAIDKCPARNPGSDQSMESTSIPGNCWGPHGF
jgi:hypothetical protein